MTSATADPVTLRVEDRVAILTLSAPEKRNALSGAIRELLVARLRELDASDEVRAIVLTGAAGHFSAGGDISEMAQPGQNNDPVVGRRRMEMLHDGVRILAGGSKPAVAAVDGSAFGAGFSLAMACDWVVAAEDARFGAAFGKIGLMGDCGLLWTLPRRIGHRAARDLLLTARVVPAEEAGRLGIADEVVPTGRALAAALKKCAQYAPVAPRAAAATKSTLARGAASLDELLRMELDAQINLAQSRDHAEARRAFLEKRSIAFTGR